MGMMNSLSFGGINSADYGVWITGSGTFSAPERDVEFVPVPGRNGDLAIDNGRWRNIDVVYPANIPTDFEAKMTAFRSALCSKRGYQRLEDTYHLDEFRLGVLTSGIQAEPIPLNRGGDFNLVFNCKPQRYLKSGEIAIQLMPWVPTTYRSQYIAVEGESVKYKVHAPAGDQLTLLFSTYDGVPSQVRTATATVEDGDTGSFAFTDPDDRFWRIEISNGVNDAEDVSIELSFELDYFISGIKHVNAIFGQYFSLKNPTGYASKPLVDYWGSIVPMTVWENYQDGVELYYYTFHSNYVNSYELFLDCDLQYLYDYTKTNQTSNLTLTTTGSGPGEGIVFPQISEDETRLNMYFTTSDIDYGPGIVNIYPHWWRL